MTGFNYIVQVKVLVFMRFFLLITYFVFNYEIC